MKKIILALALIVFTLPLMACVSGTDMRVSVRNDIATFYSTSANVEFINGNISYNENINALIEDSNSQYSALKYYGKILQMNFIVIEKFYQSFDISPVQNKNKEYGVCRIVGANLNKYIKEIDEFKTARETFINENSDVPLSTEVAKSNLKIFEKAFANLIYSANDLSESFINAYITLYANIDASSEQTVTTSKTIDFVVDCYGDLLNSYINYALIEFKGVHPMEISDFFLGLDELSHKLDTYSGDKSIQTDFSSWLTFKANFDNEVEIFNTALSKVDLTKDNSKENGLNAIYLKTVDNFVKTNAKLFINQTINLFK